MAKYVLFESASGFSLFDVKAVDDVALSTDAVQESIGDMTRFSKIASLIAFKPFSTAADALEQINSVSESLTTDMLVNFLTSNLPKIKDGKKAKWKLGVVDAKLANVISEVAGIPCTSDKVVAELARGIRMHFSHYVKQLEEHTWRDAQRGLAHSYSRAKVKFNVNRVDNMIIQAISLLDTLDKDVNTFIMRVREWYGWHFPELAKIVADNFQYARVVMLAKDKMNISNDMVDDLKEVVGDQDVAEQIVQAAKASMGQDISPVDLANIDLFAKRVISLAEYRQKLFTYLHDRMHAVAPNLSALIGEVIGARLISHAGSLTNLAKAPASTVQILGAEKALFRALKTKGNTPKYGLIFHSTFIGRAKARNKGRISRYLANKCSIATRIDAFMDAATSVFGEKMKDQVEERLRFYDDGVAPRKNATVMAEAMQQSKTDVQDALSEDELPAAGPSKKLRKKRASEASDISEAAEPKKKKKKKSKKSADE
eukprot:jgi/Ulvmu1/7221/UM035_0007.1